MTTRAEHSAGLPDIGQELRNARRPAPGLVVAVTMGVGASIFLAGVVVGGLFVLLLAPS